MMDLTYFRPSLLLICLLCGLTVTALSASQANPDQQIYNSDQGTLIVLHKLEFGTQKSLRNLLPNASEIVKSNPSTVAQTSSMATDRVFLVVVPEDGKLSAVLESQQTSEAPAELREKLLERGLQFNSRIGVEIRRIGLSRGHHLARLTLHCVQGNALESQLQLLSSARIRVQWTSILQRRSLSENERPLLHVCNEGYVDKNFVSRQTSLHHAPASQSQVQASLPERIRLSTTKDGVAQLHGKEMLRVFPQWLGCSTSALRMMCNGVEQRLYVPSATRLDTNTRVYFLGRHAASGSDTLWLSTFSNECTYFLDLDSSTAHLRYSERAAQASAPISSQVEVFHHFEEDHEYIKAFSRGSDFSDLFWTPPSAGEMWSWKIFNRDIPFQTTVPFVPSMASDSVDLRIAYESINDFLLANPDKRVRCLINGEVVYDETFDGARSKDIRLRLPSSILDAGSLTFVAQSIGANTQVPQYSERQGFDFFELKSLSSAGFAINGTLQARAHAQSDAQLRVSLLSGAETICLDTAQAEACQVKGKGVESVIAVARLAPGSWSSQMINGRSVLASSVSGLNITIRVPGVDTVQHWDGTSSDPDAASFVQSAPIGSTIVLSSNDKRSFSAALNTVLGTLGFQRAMSRPANFCYVGAVRRVVSARAHESADSMNAILRDTLETEQASCYEALVPLRTGVNDVVVSAGAGVEECVAVDAGHDDLLNTQNAADYIIITHHSFRAQADDLAAFRAKQGHRSRVVDVEEVYRDFSFGQKRPEAIRDFLKYAYTSWTAPVVHDVLLFGDASYDNRRVAANSIMTDYIPAYGYPVSDVYYSLVDGADAVQDFNIGRLPVQTATQAQQLVAKIKRYDSLPPDLWWKTFLFVSGGTDNSDPQNFLDINMSLEGLVYSDNPDVRSHTICGDTINAAMLYQLSVPGYSTSEEIRKVVNGRGTSWINFVAHGSPQKTDVNDWDASSLGNVDRPFVIATLSCQTAAFAEPETNCIDENFLLAEQKGAIAAIGATGYGVPAVQGDIMFRSFYQMTEFGDRAFGSILSNAIALVGQGTDTVHQVVFAQCCLLGDPLSRIPFDTIARPIPMPELLRISDRTGSQFISDDEDSAFVHIGFFNAGMHADSVKVRIVHRFENQSDSLWMVLEDLCMVNGLDFAVRVKGKTGRHTLEVYCDPGNAGSNTRLPSFNTLSFDVFAPKPLPVDPLPLWNVSSSHPVFRVVVPTLKPEDYEYETQLKLGSAVLDSLQLQQLKGLRIDECFVEWKPERRLIDGERYTFAMRTLNKKNQRLGAWLEIPFTASPDSTSADIFLQSDMRHDASEFSHSASLRPDTSNGVSSLVLNRQVPFTLRSAVGHGYLDSLGVVRFNPDRALLMSIDGVTYGDRSDFRGFNIRQMNRRTGIVHAVRRFDCFVDADTCDTCLNGSGRSLYHYLRDSIDRDDYLFMAICDNSYGDVFVKRDLDTVRRELKKMGALLSDSLVPPHSYVLALSYADKRVIAEKMRMDTLTKYSFEDTVEVQGTVPIQPDSAYVMSPVYGPARHWKRAEWKGKLSDSVCLKYCQVYGMESAYSTPVLLFSDSNSTIDLHSVDAELYPYLRFDIAMRRSSYSTDPSVEGLRVDIDPLPEIAVIPASAMISRDSVLRGDTIFVAAAAKRISQRAAVDSSRFLYRRIPLSGSGTQNTRGLTMLAMPLDSAFSIRDTSSTLGFATLTRNSYTVDVESVFPELYRFNNNLSFDGRVTDDVWIPSMEIDVDSQPTFSGMRVQRDPFVRVVMHDNSDMPLEESFHLRAVLNGNDTLIIHSAEYEFLGSTAIPRNLGYSPDVRAYLQFRPHLEFGENRLKIISEDFFGNTKDSVLTLIVDRDVKLGSVGVQPNPLSDYCTISYELHSPQSRQTATLQIYDLRGELVRSYDLVSRIGINKVFFDGNDQQGRRLDQGSYYYRIFISENGSLDADHGVLVIVR